MRQAVIFANTVGLAARASCCCRSSWQLLEVIIKYQVWAKTDKGVPVVVRYVIL